MSPKTPANKNTHTHTVREKCLYSEFSDLYLATLGLNIQSKCGKIRTRKTRDTDTFYTVIHACAEDQPFLKGVLLYWLRAFSYMGIYVSFFYKVKEA